MQVEIFSICDAATADPMGKLNILGSFDTIWLTTVPSVYPHFAIALRIRFDAIERGNHKISINFVDQDGKHIIQPSEGTITIDFPEDHRSGSANSVINIQNLSFAQLGEYSLDLAVDGRREASLPLFIRHRINN